MAVLKDLIVHGASRFLNGANFKTINAESIGADAGIFNKLIATSLDAKTATIDDLTAKNATVTALLDVQGEMHTNSWSNANIATIDGSFYISPTSSSADGNDVDASTYTPTGTITYSNGNYTKLVITGTFNTSQLNLETATNVAWPANSYVIVTGDVLIDNEWYPLGTIRGKLQSQLAANINSKSITVIPIGAIIIDGEIGNSSLTDGHGSKPQTLEAIRNASSSAVNGSTTLKMRKIKVSMTSYGGTYQSPIGIFMTAMGSNKKTFLDIYSGSNDTTTIPSDSGALAKPVLRIGNLSGLPALGAVTPTGWGIYTTNGFFTGTIVAKQGKIGDGIAAWTIGNDGNNRAYIYSGITNITNSGPTTGIYVGTNGISNYNSPTQYVNLTNGKITAQGVDIAGKITASSGQIGGFTIDETSIHNKMESFNDEILIPHEEGDVLIISDIEGDYLVDNYDLGTNDYLEGDIEVDDFSGIYMGTDGIALGKGVFKINKYGSLYATNATIEGDITATSGKFGVETGYYEVDEHGLIGYIVGGNGMVTSGTELGYDYLKTDKIIASDGMRVMDENDTFVSFERTSSIFGIDGQSRFFISATGLNFINGREQSLFSVAQDQVERIEKTATVISFSTNTDVNELTRFISDIDVVEEITPYAELKINDNNDTRYRPYTLINCVVTPESGVDVTINSDAVDDIISKMSYTYLYEYYEVTTDSTIVEEKNYYDSSENLIDPSDYVDSETGEQKSPSEEGWLEYKVESRTGYYSCTINVIYTANIISSSVVKIRGNIEVTSQGNPIRIINNEWNTNEGGNTDTMLRVTNTVTEVEVGFGVDSGGQNHGIWSEKIKNWIIYCDNNNNIQIPAKLWGTIGEFTEHLRVINNGINGASVFSKCNNKEVALHVSNSGNRGIYDTYRGAWMIYSPPAGGAYIPQALNVSGSIWVTSGGEAQVGTKAGSGRLYLYSSSGTRGIYGYNTSGTGAYVFYVDQSGRTYFPNPTTFSANITAQNSSGIALHAICGSYNVALHANTAGNRGVYDSTSSQWTIYRNASHQLHTGTIYIDGDIYDNSGALHLGTGYGTNLHVSCVWSDNGWHDIITRNGSSNDVYIGGSKDITGITTRTFIRGDTIKLNDASGASISSDRNIKKDIATYDEKYDDFYDALNPVTYKFINGKSGRTHSGFISQDVRDALLSSGLSAEDFGGYIKDEITYRETDTDGSDFETSDVNYLLDHGINEIHQLIYQEFIALNTWQIQKLKKRVLELEKELEELKKTL